MERRLGRGLGSLLGDAPAAESRGPVTELALDAIKPNAHQPRRVFEPEALDELVSSIRQHGVLQPVVVRPSANGFDLIAGERRWRASRQAGLTTIPAVVRAGVTDAEMLELALVENVQRQDLNPIERARGYQQMMERLSATQAQVADKVGLKRATVANHLRLLELPQVAQEAVSSGLISMGHAKALIGLGDDAKVGEVVARIVREELSVRDVEKLAQDARGKPSVEPAAKVLTPRAAWVAELEARMRTHLGSKVEIRAGENYTGRITIDYFGRDDLDRLCAILAPRELL